MNDSYSLSKKVCKHAKKTREIAMCQIKKQNKAEKLAKQRWFFDTFNFTNFLTKKDLAEVLTWTLYFR